MQLGLTVRMVSASLVLASCGGGGGGSTGGGGGFVFPTDYDARLDASHQLNDQANAAAVTPDTSMPQSGSATYQGYAALGGGDVPVNLLGNAHLGADFAAGTINGSIDGFQGYHGGYDPSAPSSYGGSLTVSGGDIGVVTGSDVTANLNGSLTRDGDTLSINGALVGDFHGDAAQYLLLFVNGTYGGSATGSMDGTISTIKP